MVSVVGVKGGDLVGPDGEVLEALQELTRLAVHRQTGERSRLMLDVGGYRERRRAELTKLGTEIADEVKRTGEPKALQPMTPFERKIVHDAVAAAGPAQRVGGRGAPPLRGGPARLGASCTDSAVARPRTRCRPCHGSAGLCHGREPAVAPVTAVDARTPSVARMCRTARDLLFSAGAVVFA